MKGKNKKTYRRKKLDIVKTLKAYENRIMSLPRGEFDKEKVENIRYIFFVKHTLYWNVSARPRGSFCTHL